MTPCCVGVQPAEGRPNGQASRLDRRGIKLRQETTGGKEWLFIPVNAYLWWGGGHEAT